MALLPAGRRASAVIRPRAVAAMFSSSTKRSSSSFSIRAIRAARGNADSYRDEAAAYRAQAASLRAQADSLRATTHDGEVLGVIDSMIQSLGSNPVDGLPGEFPFKISKEDGLTGITLTRSLKGEKIEVLVSMSKPDGNGEEPSYNGYMCDEEDEDNMAMPLTVTVSKADGSSLQFTCTAYHEQITIETLSVRQRRTRAEEQEVAGASADDPVAYDECPDLSEVDYGLRGAFRKYLELRGITVMNAKFLHKYLIRKDVRCYQLWLTKLRDFVNKD